MISLSDLMYILAWSLDDGLDGVELNSSSVKAPSRCNLDVGALPTLIPTYPSLPRTQNAWSIVSHYIGRDLYRIICVGGIP
jgi:hypothetical protein